MKYIGIDYGTKKIGIARSEEEGKVAFPVVVIPNDKGHESLFALLEKEQPDAIVVGDSKNLDGNDNPVMEHIRELVTDITLNFGTPVHYAPEFFTSVQAKQTTSNEKADAAAAALILQTFLDSK